MKGNTTRRKKERITVCCCPTALVSNDRTATEYRDRSANIDGGGGEELSIVHEDEEGPVDADAADPVLAVPVARRSR